MLSATLRPGVNVPVSQISEFVFKNKLKCNPKRWKPQAIPAKIFPEQPRRSQAYGTIGSTQFEEKFTPPASAAIRCRPLSDVSFDLESGEFVAAMGESGSGKTTLLNILAALDRPTSGQVLLNGQDLTAIPEGRLAAFRRENLGFVFQDFNLLDTFSLQDNILLPLVLAGVPYGQMQKRLQPLAAQLAPDGALKKFPHEVSGGQKAAGRCGWPASPIPS